MSGKGVDSRRPALCGGVVAGCGVITKVDELFEQAQAALGDYPIVSVL